MRNLAFRNSIRAFQHILRKTNLSQPQWLRNNGVQRLTPVSNIFTSRTFTTDADWTDAKFNDVVKDNKMVVFMKGVPDAPMCGFSKYVIQILTMHGCKDFTTFNVLDDEVLRSRVKEFSNWPTIPQVYIDGEFIGGFDILLQMHQNGELIEELDKIGHRSVLIDAENE